MSTPEERFIAHRNARTARWHVLYVLLGIGGAAAIVLVLLVIVHGIHAVWLWAVLAAVCFADIVIVLWMARHPRQLESLTNDELHKIYPDE